MVSVAIFSFATGFGDYKWPISSKAVHMDVAFWKFSNNPLNYASVVNAMTYLMKIHTTCTGPFSWGISVISVVYFWQRENILLL